jgi:VWFA-related protein
MRTSLWLALTIAAVVAAAASSQSSVAAQAGNNRERTLFVSAVDDKGEPVGGLGPDAFVVKEDGRRREVIRVSRAAEPLDVALIVDNSQAAAAYVTYFREALAKFVSAMGNEHRIALIGLAERATALVQYTTNKAELTSAIGRLFTVSGSGMTLLDALYESSRGLRRRDSARAAFVPVITDGVEFTNRYSKDIIRELLESGASLHAVTIGRFPYDDEHSIRERAFLLDDGPKATGGQHISLLAPNPLPATMERLARELSAQYKVVYGRPDSPFGGNSVEVTSGRPGLTVRGGPARGEAKAKK